jgi:hypothetical protein
LVRRGVLEGCKLVRRGVLEGCKLVRRGVDWALWSTTMPEADHAHIWLFSVGGCVYRSFPDAETVRHILESSPAENS